MCDAHPSIEPAFTALVRRIGAGERQAEEELVGYFDEGLGLMLRRLTRDSELARDLLQDTFRIVLEKARAGEIHEPERLAGFLRGTARNLYLAEGRRRRRRLARDTRAFSEGGPATEEAPQLRWVLRREEAGLVRRLLGEMRSERDRRILVDVYLSDRTKQEICSELGVDLGGFKKVLFHARRRFRELWERAEKRQRLAEEAP